MKIYMVLITTLLVQSVFSQRSENTDASTKTHKNAGTDFFSRCCLRKQYIRW